MSEEVETEPSPAEKNFKKILEEAKQFGAVASAFVSSLEPLKVDPSREPFSTDRLIVETEGQEMVMGVNNSPVSGQISIPGGPMGEFSLTIRRTPDGQLTQMEGYYLDRQGVGTTLNVTRPSPQPDQ